jgi:hypothetical protein
MDTRCSMLITGDSFRLIYLLFLLYSENLLDFPAKNTQEILPEKKNELVTISQ